MITSNTSGEKEHDGYNCSFIGHNMSRIVSLPFLWYPLLTKKFVVAQIQFDQKRQIPNFRGDETW